MHVLHAAPSFGVDECAEPVSRWSPKPRRMVAAGPLCTTYPGGERRVVDGNEAVQEAGLVFGDEEREGKDPFQMQWQRPGYMPDKEWGGRG